MRRLRAFFADGAISLSSLAPSTKCAPNSFSGFFLSFRFPSLAMQHRICFRRAGFFFFLINLPYSVGFYSNILDDGFGTLIRSRIFMVTNKAVFLWLQKTRNLVANIAEIWSQTKQKFAYKQSRNFWLQTRDAKIEP